MTARILVDNFFNPRIYTGHTLSSNENSDNTPLVGAGRRTTFDAWTPSTLNADAWNKTRCGTPRAADMAVIDRPHNLTTKTVKIQVSDTDFVTTPEDAFNGALPIGAGSGVLTDAFGVLTSEGAWLKRFDLRSGYDWRALYAAMGTGLKPTIPGLWIGLSYSPGFPWRPHQPQGLSELIVEETESDLGWRGAGRPAKRRQGRLLFRFTTFDEYEAADWHIQRIAERRPFWVIPDETRGDRAVLATMPRGTIGDVIDPGWAYPTLELPWLELDPAESI